MSRGNPHESWLKSRNGKVRIFAGSCICVNTPQALHEKEGISISGGSVAKFDFWAKSKNLVSGIQ
jgi:hypothetical protein